MNNRYKLLFVLWIALLVFIEINTLGLIDGIKVVVGILVLCTAMIPVLIKVCKWADKGG